jgi:hypothetical protein
MLLWRPPGDHTVSIRPNNPQVAGVCDRLDASELRRRLLPRSGGQGVAGSNPAVPTSFRTPYRPTGNETRHDRSHLASAGRARPTQGEARPDANGPTPAPKITCARSTSAAAGSAHKRWAHQHERPSLTLPVQHLGRSSLPGIRHHGVTAAERAPQPVPPRRPRSIRAWAATDSEHPGEGWQS